MEGVPSFEPVLVPRAAIVIAFGIAAMLGACGGDEEEDSGTRSVEATGESGYPTTVDIDTAPEHERGRQVLASSGCLACHRMGGSGNQGPGPDLTHVGRDRPREAIVENLLEPTPPMPSYEQLRRKRPGDFRALVDFLAAAR